MYSQRDLNFYDQGHAIERKILDDIYSSYCALRRLELERTQEENDFVGQMRLLCQKT